MIALVITLATTVRPAACVSQVWNVHLLRFDNNDAFPNLIKTADRRRCCNTGEMETNVLRRSVIQWA